VSPLTHFRHSQEADPNAVNDGASVAVSVVEKADLGVSIADSPDPTQLGGNVTYTITVTNNGPGTATSVSVTDNLGGAIFVPTGSSANCTGAGPVSCAVGSLASGTSATLTIVTTPGNTGTLTNTASATETEIDPVSANNTATATTTVIAPDLIPTAFSVSKSKGKVIVSDTVKNQGNGNAGTFTVAYYLSTNTTYEPGTDIPLASSSGGSGVCTRTVTSISAGLTSSVSNKTCYKPSGAVTGTRYYVLVVDDATNQVIESNETNNVRAASGQVWW